MQSGSALHATVPAAQPVSAPRMNGAVPLQNPSVNPVMPFLAIRLRRDQISADVCDHKDAPRQLLSQTMCTRLSGGAHRACSDGKAAIPAGTFPEMRLNDRSLRARAEGRVSLSWRGHGDGASPL